MKREAVTIPRDVLAAIVAHGAQARPDECCGLLVGRGAEILEAVPVPNIADTKRTRYELDPADYIRGRRDARARGLDILGFYHSHPKSSAEPSATDLAEALYPDHLYLIVGWPEGSESAETRAFRLQASAFEEMLLIVT